MAKTAAVSATPTPAMTTTGTKLKRVQAYQDYRFLIVWLEKFEDFAAVPTGKCDGSLWEGSDGGHMGKNRFR